MTTRGSPQCRDDVANLRGRSLSSHNDAVGDALGCKIVWVGERMPVGHIDGLRNFQVHVIGSGGDDDGWVPRLAGGEVGPEHLWVLRTRPGKTPPDFLARLAADGCLSGACPPGPSAVEGATGGETPLWFWALVPPAPALVFHALTAQDLLYVLSAHALRPVVDNTAANAVQAAWFCPVVRGEASFRYERDGGGWCNRSDMFVYQL